MHKNINIPKNLFIAFFIVAFTLFVSCDGVTDTSQEPSQTDQNATSDSPVIQGWEKAPVSEELTKWLKHNGSAMVLFVSKDGRARVSNLKGEEVKSCGKLVGARIEGECKGLESATINSLSQEFTIITSKSPDCITRCFMGMLFQVDAETGEYPCRSQ